MAKSLKEWRNERELSLRALAERSGVHFTSISEIEQGSRRPHAQTASKLAHALGIGLLQIEEFHRPAQEGTPPQDGEFELLASPSRSVKEPGPQYIHEYMLRLLRDMAEYLIRAGHGSDVERMLREVLEDTEGDQR